MTGGLFDSGVGYSKRAQAWADTLDASEALACIAAISKSLNGLATKVGPVPDLGIYTAAVNTAVVHSGIIFSLAHRIHTLGMAADNRAVADLNRFVAQLTDDLNAAGRKSAEGDADA